MDSDTRQPLRVSLYGVEDRGRLTVRHTGDEVSLLLDVLEHVLS
jgi:hypothetical protein